MNYILSYFKRKKLPGLLNNLTKGEKAVFREFYIRDKKFLKLRCDDYHVFALANQKLIINVSPVSNNGLVGTFATYRINKHLIKIMDPELHLDLPAHFTETDLKKLGRSEAVKHTENR